MTQLANQLRARGKFHARKIRLLVEEIKVLQTDIRRRIGEDSRLFKTLENSERDAEVSFVSEILKDI